MFKYVFIDFTEPNMLKYTFLFMIGLILLFIIMKTLFILSFQIRSISITHTFLCNVLIQQIPFFYHHFLNYLSPPLFPSYCVSLSTYHISFCSLYLTLYLSFFIFFPSYYAYLWTFWSLCLLKCYFIGQPCKFLSLLTIKSLLFEFTRICFVLVQLGLLIEVEIQRKGKGLSIEVEVQREGKGFSIEVEVQREGKAKLPVLFDIKAL